MLRILDHHHHEFGIILYSSLWLYSNINMFKFILFLVFSSSILDIVTISDEFMYMFAKRLARLSSELSDRLNVAWCLYVVYLGMCWRSLMLTFNRQLIMEKDRYATYIQNWGFIWQNSMSFGVCLFLQGVIRKYEGRAHMSGLHRDINFCGNFLSSRRLQKPRERTGGRAGPEAGRPPSPLGRLPSYRS